ncbi:hypothetical protein SUNI508_00279 [Seiridium unicorne]|uniref:Phosphatidic acid phosphatase type 2/haloperoxidase domain-containing protein n=1 Tax=Seiridium unicorne TaxID=138068 RepID=A0ABR2VIH1_9PEZI
MGFLSRRKQPQAGATPKKGGKKPWLRPAKAYSVEQRPSFGQWLKVTSLDLFTLMVFRVVPAATRTFPLTVLSTGEVVYPQFAYPYRDQFIPSWLATVFALVIPIVVILLAQIRIRSFWDINNGIIGLVYAVLTASAFQVALKCLIGGLRPNFYDVCKPDPSRATQGHGIGYQNYMFTREICTGELQEGINNALQSFPSGHTTTMFAGMVFLYLYLNAKLKVFSNYQPSLWKLVLLYLPILGATLVGGSLTVDQSHNWYDIVAGAIIGTVFAFSAYRMMYAAIWNYRINHIPLNRGSAFEWREGTEGADFVFSEHAGWKSRRKRKTSALPAPVTSTASGHMNGQTNEHNVGDARASMSSARRGDGMV